MKITIFIGIAAVLVQNISCYCQATDSPDFLACCSSPTSPSCCYNQENDCCVDGNGRCESSLKVVESERCRLEAARGEFDPTFNTPHSYFRIF